MSWEQPEMNLGVFPADLDMSGTVQDGVPTDSVFQFSVVQIKAAANTAGYGFGGAAVAPPAAAGGADIGILQNNPQLGEAAEVMVAGVSKAQIGANVTIGQILMAAAPNGQGVSQLIPATNGNYGIAMALETGSAGAIAAVLLRNFGKQ